MNCTFESVYPDLIKSGLEKLQLLDAQRELTGLFSALQQFRRDLQIQESTAGILEITRCYLDGLNLFRAGGFWLVNSSDLSFEPTLIFPETERESLWQLAEAEIQNGGFARALRKEGSLFVQNNSSESGERGLLHPMKLPNQILGMFCGILHPATSHDVAFSLLSLLLGESTDALVTLRRTRKLATQVDLLDGLLPFCAWCKKVRNDRGYWEQIERYIAQNSRTSLTHGICPDCRKKFLAGIPEKPAHINRQKPEAVRG